MNLKSTNCFQNRTPQSKERVCVVMPVYNEQAVIGKVLSKWDQALRNLKIDYVIRAYNDGSRDNSLKAMQDVVQARHLNVDVRDKPNGGHGDTILLGYREASSDGFDWIFQVDSDDEMGPEHFADLWNNRQDFDFLLGKRDSRQQTAARKLVSWGSRMCSRVFYGKGVWDVNSPYRLMRVSAFRSLFAALPSKTFAPNVILSGLAARHGLRCLEIPVPHQCRNTGEVSIAKWKLFKAAMKSFSQTAAVAANTPRGWLFFGLLAVLSTLLKFHASQAGWNWDYESYEIVAGIVNAGGNVYAETSRYNYGPVWFWVLGFLRRCLGDGFRMGIITLLSTCDIAIGAYLWKRKWVIPTVLFMLSNVSVHITGSHNQFDNFAIAVALGALSLIESAPPHGAKRYWGGVALLGLSIAIKHIFAFFPFWLLFRPGKWSRRILSCILPLLVFGISFLPYAGLRDVMQHPGIKDWVRHVPDYISSGQFRASFETLCQGDAQSVLAPLAGIGKHVFLYQSGYGGAFYFWFLPYRLTKLIPPMPVFLFLMLLLGWASRRRPLFKSGLIYTLGIVVFSHSIAAQYFAIPAAAAAVCWWPFGLLYHLVVGTVFWIFNAKQKIPVVQLDIWAMFILAGCLYQEFRTEILTGILWTTKEIQRRIKL